MRKITVYLTSTTYAQLLWLAGGPSPQLLHMTARSLLTYAIRAMCKPGATIDGRTFLTKLGDGSPTEEKAD